VDPRVIPNPSGLAADGTGDCADKDCPVGNVTWFETLAFANLLSQREGYAQCYVLEGCQGELGGGMVCETARLAEASVYDCPGYRLPTGAEWEYAARAGTKTAVYTGKVVEHAPAYVCFDDPVLSPIAWYCANAGSSTHPVGRRRPNKGGLYDVIGNAAEWVGSGVEAYGKGPYVDLGAELGVSGFSARAVIETRGGNWFCWPNMLRVSGRGGVPAWGSNPGLGFRLAQTIVDGGKAP
jgi:formylglycine-generating enzyme required for sulfatase activity